MSANFNPEKGEYIKPEAFRFWCQKVLPTVYDDSLSYYELLTKFVNFLNETASNIEGFNTTIDNTITAFNELQDYVNHYFDNLDIETEINHKLDILASNGTLTRLITPLMPDLVSTWLAENITAPTGSPAVDASLTISGAAADAKATGDALDNVSDIFDEYYSLTGKNLINNNDVTNGYYCDYRTGNLDSAEGFCVTTYIPVIGGSTYTFSNRSSEFGVGQCCFYDHDKTFISGLSNTGIVDSVTFTVPITARYIRWSYPISLKYQVQLEKGSVVTEYVPYNNKLTGKNLINTKELTNGYYCDYRNGNMESAPNFSVTNYIPVEGGSKYTFTNRSANDGVGQCCFYNEDKEFISGLANSGVATIITISVPSNAKYIRWSFPTSLKNQVQLEKGIVGTAYDPFEEDYDYVEYYTKRHCAPIEHVNLIDPDMITEGYYCDYRTGNLVALSTFGVTDYIEVEEGSTYTFTNNSASGVSQCCFYDKYHNFISGLSNSGIQNSVTFTVPNGAYYIRWSIDLALKNMSMLEKGDGSETFIPYSTMKVPVKYIPDLENVDTVYVGANRKYTSILKALKSGAKTIYIDSGTYDIYTEYEEEYGSNFWTNYTGYAGNSDPFMRGLWVNEGVKLIGNGNVIITFTQSTSFNENIGLHFSIFACASNITIKNITINVNGNCQYHIHDDFMNSGGIVNFENIVFQGVTFSRVCIGGGLGINVTYIINECNFIYDGGVNYNISYHGCTANEQTQCKIYVTNCSGGGKLGFRWYGQSQLITRCYVSACKFNRIECIAYDASQPYQNMTLIEWCNETAN